MYLGYGCKLCQQAMIQTSVALGSTLVRRGLTLPTNEGLGNTAILQM